MSHPQFETRIRQTGRIVRVGHALDLDLDPNDGPWYAICVEHSTLSSHATLRLARYHSRAPLDWCENCREGVDVDALPARAAKPRTRKSKRDRSRSRREPDSSLIYVVCPKQGCDRSVGILPEASASCNKHHVLMIPRDRKKEVQPS